MAKNKGRKLASNTSKKHKQPPSKSSKPTGITKSAPKALPSKTTPHPQHAEPTIPFTPTDRIFLVGEGDLSFARSLVEELAFEDVVATVYESEEELKEKYPQAEENVQAIEGGGGNVRYGVDAVKGGGTAWREMRGRCDKVVFNFPHVGGKSTDVNRQVRYNQELLVAFFKNALQALAPSTSAIAASTSSHIPEDLKTSSIIVTLFEGEPYTLWNIRDLARHSGLQVERSFKFQAKAYPGYKHARTLGVVKNKKGEEGGGWKGEERAARSYIFVRKGEGEVQQVKKKKVESSDDEDDDEEKEKAGKRKRKGDDWTPGGIGENAIHPSRRGNLSGS